MTTTPEYGLPLPPDSSRIADFPKNLRHQSQQLEALLPGAMNDAAKVYVPGEVSRQTQPALTDAAAAKASAAESAQTVQSITGPWETRLHGLEALGGLSPEGVTDGQTSDLIAQEGTLTRAALDAATEQTIGDPETVTPTLLSALTSVGPSAASLAASALARANTNPPPILTPIVTGDPAQTGVAGLSGVNLTTITSVPSPSDPAKTVWQAVRDAAGTVTGLNVTLANLTPPTPAQAVTAWIYIPDPSVVTQVEMNITAASGQWIRNNSQAGSNMPTIRPGWNLFRWVAHAVPVPLTGITRAIVRVFHTSGRPTFLFGPVVLESRPKSALVFINDWGARQFLINGYPALKALGVPVTWAIRPNRLGTGTYPHEHITHEEALSLAQENGNVISFHSWDGAPTRNMTAEEIRVETLTALAHLHALGLFGRGSTHRAAWVQNQADNAPAAHPYYALAPTDKDSTVLTPWPPLDRLRIPRIGIHGMTTAQMDAQFAQMQSTGESALFYTHGVTAEPTTDNATQAQWDYFVTKVQAGLNGGWLEGRTLADLLDTDRAEMPLAPL